MKTGGKKAINEPVVVTLYEWWCNWWRGPSLWKDLLAILLIIVSTIFISSAVLGIALAIK